MKILILTFFILFFIPFENKPLKDHRKLIITRTKPKKTNKKLD